MMIPASCRMLSYNREGSRHGAEPKFITVRPSSPYIDKIPCIFHVFSVYLSLKETQTDILLFV